MGVPWGSINIGLVGEAPEIPNPLTYWQNKQNDLILSFLFRGALKYDDRLGTYEWDIANCDIADLSKVSCTLNTNNTWSDGTKIQKDDIVATLQAFKNSPPNDKMKAFLAGVTFTANGDTVQISHKEKNSLMLDLLTYPIVRSDMLERIRTGRFSKDGYITSGSYTFLEKEKNSELGYDRITIVKSEKNPGKWWLDKYHFLFFPNTSALKQWAENISIIVPGKQEEKMMLGPRFGPYEYALYEYIGFFLNTDTVNSEIRKHIVLQAETNLDGKVVEWERPINALFDLGASGSAPVKIEKTFADVMRSIGYTKPDEKLALLEKDTGVLTGSSVTYEDNKYTELPSKKKVNFSEAADGTILISGRVPTWVTAISINGYTLKEYLPGNNRFSYKVSLADGTVKEGENTYEVVFDTSTGSGVVDTVTIYYEKDTKKLAEDKKTVEDAALAKLNTPDLIKKRLDLVNAEKIKVQALDPRYYYDATFSPYTFRLMYITEPWSLAIYAGAVSEALTHLGVKGEITQIDGKWLTEMLALGKKEYDGIIVGFEANGRLSRIGQIFLSSEAKNGINFSKIESKNLDTLFAALRISSTAEKTREIEQNIQSYIEKEGFFLPISSPLHTLYIDKNLKGIKQIPTFQDITSLYELLREASIKEQYVLKLEGKWIGDFFSWLFHRL